MFEKNLSTIEEQAKATQDWRLQAELDGLLMKGINSRRTWSQFQADTGCPDHLKERYQSLQVRSGIVPNGEIDAFLAGFNHK